jgi:protein tyrosine/serine phosphatase
LDSIEKNYGSMDAFLRDAMKLSKEDILALREKYLED